MCKLILSLLRAFYVHADTVISRNEMHEVLCSLFCLRAALTSPYQPVPPRHWSLTFTGRVAHGETYRPRTVLPVPPPCCPSKPLPTPHIMYRLPVHQTGTTSVPGPYTKPVQPRYRARTPNRYNLGTGPVHQTGTTSVPGPYIWTCVWYLPVILASILFATWMTNLQPSLLDANSP